MKLWSIQNESAYEKFKEIGILRADDRFIWNEMIFHYNWMAEQMKKRIGLSILEDIKYPIWAWYQWSGIKQKKQKGQSFMPIVEYMCDWGKKNKVEA